MVTIPARIRVRGRSRRRFAAPLAARAKPPDSAGVRETPGGAGPGPPEGCRYEFKFDSELTTCQSKQISVADAARSRRLSPTAQSSVPLGRSLEAALRRSPSKHISVEDAAGTPLARRAQSHCGSYETEVLIGAGRATGWAFPIFFLKIWCQHVLRFIPCLHSRWLMPYLSNSAQKRSPKQKRLLFWYKLVAAVGTEILVAFCRYRITPGDNNRKIDL